MGFLEQLGLKDKAKTDPATGAQPVGEALDEPVGHLHGELLGVLEGPVPLSEAELAAIPGMERKNGSNPDATSRTYYETSKVPPEFRTGTVGNPGKTRDTLSPRDSMEARTYGLIGGYPRLMKEEWAGTANDSRNGNSMHVSYDERGFPVRAEAKDRGGRVRLVVENVFDDNGRLLEQSRSEFKADGTTDGPTLVQEQLYHGDNEGNLSGYVKGYRQKGASEDILTVDRIYPFPYIGVDRWNKV